MVTLTRTVLGRLLVRTGALTEDQLAEALAEQERVPRRLGEILLEQGTVSEETLARSLAEQLGLPFQPPPLTTEPDAARLLSEELARRLVVLPLSTTARALRVAMADPLDATALDDVRFQCGRRVDAVVSTATAVRLGLARTYGGDLESLLSELPTAEDGGGDDRSSLERAARSTPVVRLVDHLLRRAVDEGASDIHVEGDGDRFRVRFRLDGVLRPVMDLPPGARSAILSRLKVMAGMDIAVKRRPQDGSLPLTQGGRDLTLRVSTLPANGAEKAVLRILDPRRAPDDLTALGMGVDDLERVRSVLRSGQGVLLAAGPTGSGKSSTLYAALQEVDRSRLNVVTLEDPVEYRLRGLSQVQVEPRAGLTFPAALRAVLRQDPDVIMVGEIRDRETAEIAMAAAVTGHLVLSTIHTMDAPGAVTRLMDMGVPPYLVAGGLAGVVAQRLVRTVCGHCRARTDRGCERCRGGYDGRTGVFQVLVMSDSMRDAVVRGSSTAALRRLGEDAGMGSLADDARRKVAEGRSTPHEVSRVLHGDPGAAIPCRGCGGGVPPEAEGCPTCGRSRTRRCPCGRSLKDGWRFCPWCLRKI